MEKIPSGRHTREFQKEAVRSVIEEGLSPGEAPRRLALPKSTAETRIIGGRSRKMKPTVIIALCFTSLILADLVQADSIISEVTRPFTGTYTWWSAVSSGETFLEGTIDFRLNNWGNLDPDHPLWVGIKGSTYDGRLTFEDDFYYPGEWTYVTENYSTNNSFPNGSPGLVGGYGPRPDIFENNSPIFLSIKNLYVVENGEVVLEAKLMIYADPAPVPEPATMLLFCTSIAGLVVAGRKKNP